MPDDDGDAGGGGDPPSSDDEGGGDKPLAIENGEAAEGGVPERVVLVVREEREEVRRKAAAEADLVAARRATTHEQYASIVRDLCAPARGGVHPAQPLFRPQKRSSCMKAQNSNPRAGRGSGRIGETLSKPAHMHEEVRRL